MVNLSRGASPTGQLASPRHRRPPGRVRSRRWFDLDRIQEAPADEFGAGDERARRTDVFLQQMQPVDRRLVGVAGKVVGEAFGGHEQPHAQALAAAVRLQDDGLTGEVAPRGGDKMLAPRHQDGARRGDAVALQCCVLAGLADLRSSAPGPLTTRRSQRVSQASTAAVSSAEKRWSRVCDEALMRL